MSTTTTTPADATEAPAAGVSVCRLVDLLPGRGAAALIDGEQIALFRIGEEVFAVQQLDPYSGANVMSRGIVGTSGERVTVAGPMYKQVFDLRTGECLDTLGGPPHRLRTWPVAIAGDGTVRIIGIGGDPP